MKRTAPAKQRANLGAGVRHLRLLPHLTVVFLGPDSPNAHPWESREMHRTALQR